MLGLSGSDSRLAGNGIDADACRVMIVTRADFTQQRINPSAQRMQTRAAEVCDVVDVADPSANEEERA